MKKKNPLKDEVEWFDVEEQIHTAIDLWWLILIRQKHKRSFYAAEFIFSSSIPRDWRFFCFCSFFLFIFFIISFVSVLCKLIFLRMAKNADGDVIYIVDPINFNALRLFLEYFMEHKYAMWILLWIFCVLIDAVDVYFDLTIFGKLRLTWIILKVFRLISCWIWSKSSRE